MLNLHLDLLIWASGGFAAGYIVGMIRTRKRRP